MSSSNGSTFEGQWQNGKRHGLGTEYRGRWTYRGEWTQGFKGRYGVRQATASNAKYEGTWANGLQDGYGSETYADGGTYQGQWLRGLRHGYGVRTSAPFGMASHFRPKAPQGSMASLKSESAADPTSERDRRMDDVRGGFVLKARSDEPPARRRSLVERSSNFKESILKGLKLRKQRSTGDLDKRGTNSSIRSTGSSASWMSNDSAQSAVTSGSHHTDSNASFVVEDMELATTFGFPTLACEIARDEQMDASVTETYMGEWKNDKRSGFGISERSDGLKYEGEWYNNKKYGYGVTTFKDGTKEEGKYKNNVLITSQKKKHLFLIRSAKFRERIDAAVNAAQRASKIALQKADIAISRTATARGKGEQADIEATRAREDSEVARIIAKQFAPDFHQPGSEAFRHHGGARSSSQQPDLNKATTSGMNIHSQMRAKEDGTNTLSRTKQQQQQQQQQQQHLPSNDYRFEENQAHIGNNPNLSSYSQAHNAYNQSAADRLDRNSLINHPIDVTPLTTVHPQIHSHIQSFQHPSQVTSHYQQPQQQQQQPQQQPYMNRVGEGLYQTTGSNVRMSHQNLMEETKSNLKNASSLANMRNSEYMDRSPHSHLDDRMSTGGGVGQYERGRDTLRRSHISQSRPNNPNNANSYPTAMSDHFDHYKQRPGSRDSSVDRFNPNANRARSRTRAPTPEVTHGPQSRASSRHRTPFMDNPQGSTPGLRSSTMALDASLLSESQARLRGETPARNSGKESPSGGLGADNNSVISGSSVFDENIMRQRGLGQEIPPVPYTPKRTESLFIPAAVPKAPLSNLPKISGGGGGGGGAGGVPKRKKSLPDANLLPKSTPGMSREEVAALGSARRQELHRMQNEAERLRANPLLYLLNPNIKNWFSRQKLMVLVLFINLSLAIMFLQLLT
ncbi:unnamed protein product [Allacma fusca]|uniref:Junctophilin n=1 Tax=Allacma fusca TaxID=39272 RepID=A0A8J2MCR0_9HEXA|nr:unnamed protein product [Allacma fusca]